MNPLQYNPGDRAHGFLVKEVTRLERLQLTYYRLVHERTGAQLVHLANEDDNNLFAVAFPTTPTDSSGVAHILEHTALCGSQKYPVRDPFFSMIKRSLKTFMNAFTASDWTMYPFSTQNPKDFDNLLGIYLDAAFFPLLSELNFSQEGHRLEFQDPSDENSPLEFKGVVYNEMQGAMSQQSQIMHRNLGQALFPTLTYRHNSGGDPAVITDLTHEQLVKFHQSHYHPSNAFFYTYGDLPLEGHLAKIEALALSQFEAIETHTQVGTETRYREPKSFDFTYPLDPSEDNGKKGQLLLAWLTADVLEPLEVLSLELIEEILLGHSGAPLKKALLESKLGQALADGTGFENEIRQCWFGAGLQGVASADFDQVEALVLDTLNEIAQKGIDPVALETALHQMELSVREITGGGYPYGLNLLFRFFGPWVHGGDPLSALDLDQTLNQLKARLEKPGYLEGKIKQYLLDNPHRVRVSLQPDPGMQARQEAARRAKLDQIRAGLSLDEVEAIKARGLALEAHQETEEDLDCLPTLTVSDIPKEIRFYDPVLERPEARDVYLYEQPTNGISYLKCFFRLDGITDEERAWLPLLGLLLTQTGKGDLSYEGLAQEISRHTGGFSASPQSRQFLDPIPLEEYLVIGSKSLHEKLPKLFELLRLILGGLEVKEEERIISLVGQRTNGLVNHLVQSGHQYALGLASRHFSRAAQIDEIYSGLSQTRFMKELAALEPKVLLKRLTGLTGIFDRVFTASRLSVFGLGEADSLGSLETQISGLYQSLPAGAPVKPAGDQIEPVAKRVQEAWVTTTPVSYVAQAQQAPRFLDPDAPRLFVLANLLRFPYLHGEIREKGGAYGGMSGYNATLGIFSMSSYRDPHLNRTLEVFKGALGWLESTAFDQTALDEAILQCASSMDSPQSPSGRASSAYHHLKIGKTKERRLAFRQGVLGAKREELIECARRWLTGEVSVAVLTGEEILTREKNTTLERHKV